MNKLEFGGGGNEMIKCEFFFKKSKQVRKYLIGEVWVWFHSIICEIGEIRCGNKNVDVGSDEPLAKNVPIFLTKNVAKLSKMNITHLAILGVPNPQQCKLRFPSVFSTWFR
jgi:hypothetical protein